MDGAYNQSNPAVKRLMREAMELKDATELYYAQPLEDNLFEWHFTVRGPPDTDFSDGIYHGRILLPTEYPMKPPSIMLLTPNGRFELNKKICLSISGYHPESWQPSWSIRTALLAIIGFMPTPGIGALGALDYTPDERKNLARKSLEWKCAICNAKMSDVLPPLTGASLSTRAEAQQLVTQVELKDESEKSNAEPKSGENSASADENASLPEKSNVPVDRQESNVVEPQQQQNNSVESKETANNVVDSRPGESTSSSNVSSATNIAGDEPQTVRQRLRTTPNRPVLAASTSASTFTPQPAPAIVSSGQRPWDIGGAAITCLMWIAVFLLAVLLLRRLYVANEGGGFFGSANGDSSPDSETQ